MLINYTSRKGGEKKTSLSLAWKPRGMCGYILDSEVREANGGRMKEKERERGGGEEKNNEGIILEN